MKDIPGYEGLYAVTDSGEVWSYPKTWTDTLGREYSRPGAYLKHQKHTGGYRCVRLKNDDGYKQHFVHRLVAASYIENPYRLKEVNHIDCDKTNNHVSNLEWASRRQNTDHALAYGRYAGPNSPRNGSEHPGTHLTDMDVKIIRYLYIRGVPVSKMMDIFFIAKTTLHQIVRRETWTHLSDL